LVRGEAAIWRDKLKRLAVNGWIRSGGAFDGIIDFDRDLADPAHPGAMAAVYNSGDHLHPNDAGYRAMARPSI
jgi:lysophospholipase L1-like esterase